MNVTELVRKAARSDPERPAVIEAGREVTYGDLWERVEAVAAGLRALGLGEGSTVALLLPNGEEFICALLALLRINAVAVPLKVQTDRRDLRFMLEKSRPVAIFLSAELLKELIRSDSDLIAGRKVILGSERGEEPRILDPGNRLEEVELFGFSDLLSLRRKASSSPGPIRAGRTQLASINFTYRGYGYPLGSMLTHHHYIHGAIRYIKLEEIEADMRILLSLPAAHIFPLIGCIFVPLLAKATIVIAGSLTPRKLFKTIEEHRVNILASVPTLYDFLAKHFRPGEADLSSIRFGICGGEPLPEGLHERVRKKLGFEIVEGYGLTETMPVTCNRPRDNRPGTLGVPGHDVRLRISNSEGNECQTGEVGEIWVQCPSVMLAYQDAPSETSDVFQAGWFRTGDLGRVDDEGLLYFHGVIKAITKVRGITADLVNFPQSSSAGAPSGPEGVR